MIANALTFTSAPSLTMPGPLNRDTINIPRIVDGASLFHGHGFWHTLSSGQRIHISHALFRSNNPRFLWNQNHIPSVRCDWIEDPDNNWGPGGDYRGDQPVPPLRDPVRQPEKHPQKPSRVILPNEPGHDPHTRDPGDIDGIWG